MRELDYKDVFGYEERGSGHFGIKILIASSREYESEEVTKSLYKVCDNIKRIVKTEIMKRDPNIKVEADRNRELLKVFGNEKIFVEEIPNGYCKEYCCSHLPWFIVTTRVGRIKIGWRKRVINIDWEDTVGTLDSKILFQDEDVTKFGKSIHAWGYEKAAEYIHEIINTTHKD